MLDRELNTERHVVLVDVFGGDEGEGIFGGGGELLIEFREF